MADPFSASIMAGVGMAGSAGGGILSALGQQQKASADAGMYQYQAGIADFNSKIAKQNADYTLATGEQQAQLQGLKWRQQIGDTVAKQGASGTAVGVGSNKDVTDSLSRTAMLDQSIIRNNAAHTAYGQLIEAEKDTAQGAMYRGASDNVLEAGKLNALSSILGATSSVASKWSSGVSSGVL